MKYENKEEYILRFNDDGSVSSIPLDKENTDYQAYLRWLENPEAEGTIN